MKKFLPWLAIAGVAYFFWKKSKAGAVGIRRTIPRLMRPSAYQGPFATGTVSPGLSVNPPRGFALKYAASRPIGAYFTSKIRRSPAPFGAIDPSERFFAEVVLPSGRTDWVQVVQVSYAKVA